MTAVESTRSTSIINLLQIFISFLSICTCDLVDIGHISLLIIWALWIRIRIDVLGIFYSVEFPLLVFYSAHICKSE